MNLRTVLYVFSVLFYFETQAQAQHYDKHLQKKKQELRRFTEKSPYIQLTPRNYKRYVLEENRDYYFVILLTMPNCPVCWYIYSEFRTVAQSHVSNPHRGDKLFFGVLHLNEHPAIVEEFNIFAVPTVKLFPPKRNRNKGDDLNVNKGVAAADIARWISDITDIKINVYISPFSLKYHENFFMFYFLFIFCAVCYYRSGPGFFTSSDRWAAIAITFCFFTSTGQMYNYINNAPLFEKYETKRIFFDDSSQSFVESYVVAVLYGGFIISMLLVTEMLGGVVDDGLGSRTFHLRYKLTPGGRKLRAVSGIVLVNVLFSLLLSAFRYKNSDYPYRYLFA